MDMDPNARINENEESNDANNAWFANVKRTYDAYQQADLQSIHECRTHFSKVISDAQQNDNTRQNIANQALQNAVTLANLVSSNAAQGANLVNNQATAHRDIAVDNQWNPVTEGAGNAITGGVGTEALKTIALDDASLKAIGAAVAAAVVSALKTGQ